jgi:hypothetical protein
MPESPGPSTRRLAVASALLAAAVLSAGCGTRVSALYEKVLGSPSYGRTTEVHTRTKEVHDGLETRFILSATWLSDAWIRSFSEEYSNVYYLDEARKERVISRWKGESDRYVRFFLALFIPDERGNDLEKAETLWSLRLVRSDEKDYQPVYVVKSALRPEEISRFFPYSGTWYRAYEVAFPKEAMGGEPPKAPAPRLKLVLTGVQGRAVLAWD